MFESEFASESDLPAPFPVPAPTTPAPVLTPAPDFPPAPVYTPVQRQVVPNNSITRGNPEPLEKRTPRISLRRIFVLGGLLLVAGVLLGYLTQYFSRGEAALPPVVESPTQQSIEQAMALATAESASEIQTSHTPASAQEIGSPGEETQGLTEAREPLPVVENPSPLPAPVIEENEQESDSEMQVAQTADGTGGASTNDAADADPQPINNDRIGDEVREQTFLINFPSDSDELIPDSHHVLDSALVMLQENPDSVASITGFTDNRGERKYNLALSVKRANAVQQYLVSAGIAQERLVVEGRGVLTDPIEAGDTDTADSLQPYRIVQIKVSGDRPQ